MEELRRAVEADVPALNALMHASRAYDGDYRAMLDGYFVTPAQVARDLVVLAERGGETLGFYSLIVEGEPELDLMFVADAAQGRDLGCACSTTCATRPARAASRAYESSAIRQP